MAARITAPKDLPNGCFITFEGGEGSGKSTQSDLLAKTLRKEGYDVLETHEPGGSQGGKIVREVLLGGFAVDKGPLAEACLLTSARREHVDTVIRPALAAGKVVLCDRYADSTRVYQGYVGGLPADTIDRLESVATDGLLPRITFVLETDQMVANGRRIARLAQKGDANDRFEREDQSFHDKVAEGFRKLCQQQPGRCILTDGNAKPAVISQTIRDTLRLRDLL
jgi:dTMP kinase